jgi:undecaprenyl pyrophosphate phosphatase UppP
MAAAGFAAAAVTGYLAILFVLRWTREGKLWQFGLYCWAAAGIAAAALARR